MGKVVSSLFGGSTAKVPTPAPAPTVDNTAEILAKEANEQRIRSASAGRASTMLTGGEGVEEDVNSAKKKLLGA